MFSVRPKLLLLFFLIISSTTYTDARNKNNSLTVNKNKEFNTLVNQFPYLAEGFALIKNPVSFHDFMHAHLFDLYIQEEINQQNTEEEEEEEEEETKTYIDQLDATIEAAENIIITQLKPIINTCPQSSQSVESIINYITKRSGNKISEIHGALFASDAHQQTLLHKAVVVNNVKIVKDLIKAQCDLNKQDDQGNTPLHYAAKNNIGTGHFYKDEISQLLIDAGADITIENKNKEGAVDYVSESHIVFQACINLKTKTEMAQLRSKKYSLDSLTRKCLKLEAEQNKLRNANSNADRQIRYNETMQSIKRNKINIAVKSQVLQACQKLKEKKLKKEIADKNAQ